MEDSTTWKIIGKYFQENPQALVNHHIDSFDDFYKRGIFQIFKEKNPVTLYSRRHNQRIHERMSSLYGWKRRVKTTFWQTRHS
jgi:DNA-directed RNA polymerase beta subunit